MIILGIDPGYAITGFGIIKKEDQQNTLLEYGVITTKKENNKYDRIAETVNDLIEIIKAYKPDHIAIEEVFFSKNVKTAIQVAESRGAIIYQINQLKIPLFEYKPNQVKINISGYGSANKSQIQKLTQLFLNLKEIPKPDDAADALAIAICHANHLKNNNQLLI